MQECLTRDAADVEAGAAKVAALFNARYLETELRGLDCGRVSTRAAAGYDEILLIPCRGCHAPNEATRAREHRARGTGDCGGGGLAQTAHGCCSARDNRHAQRVGSRVVGSQLRVGVGKVSTSPSVCDDAPAVAVDARAPK
jgi:hypothetical protein